MGRLCILREPFVLLKESLVQSCKVMCEAGALMDHPSTDCYAITTGNASFPIDIGSTELRVWPTFSTADGS